MPYRIPNVIIIVWGIGIAILAVGLFIRFYGRKIEAE